MTPKEYLAFSEDKWAIIRQIEAEIDTVQDQAAMCGLPTSLRPANERDIIAGAILWYPDWPKQKWVIVEHVHHPSDRFKAFSYKGCRYGLDGAYIEDECSR
jgi:hypothetical protein